MFMNLSSESNVEEIVSMINSDSKLNRCDYVLISIALTDNETAIGDGFVALHAFFDLHVYDRKSGSIVKSLPSLENIGIGDGKDGARKNLMSNQIGMLSKYMLELFGRLQDGR